MEEMLQLCVCWGEAVVVVRCCSVFVLFFKHRYAKALKVFHLIAVHSQRCVFCTEGQWAFFSMTEEV